MKTIKEFLNEEMAKKATTAPKLVVGKSYIRKTKWSTSEPKKFIGYKVLTHAEKDTIKGLSEKLFTSWKDVLKEFDAKKPKELGAKLIIANSEIQNIDSQKINICIAAINEGWKDNIKDSINNVLTSLNGVDGKWTSGQKLFEDV